MRRSCCNRADVASKPQAWSCASLRTFMPLPSHASSQHLRSARRQDVQQQGAVAYAAALRKLIQPAAAELLDHDSCSSCTVRQQQRHDSIHQMLFLADGMKRAVAATLAVLQAVAMSGVLHLSIMDPAAAVLSNPNAKMPRSVSSALRRSIPALNSNVATIQGQLEDVAYLMRIPQRKPWGTMSSNVSEMLDLMQSRELLLKGTPADKMQRGSELLDELYDRLKQLQSAIDSQQPSTVSARVAAALATVAELEILQAPGLAFVIPKEYADAPRLVGRAVVKLQIESKDGADTFVKAEGGGTTSSREIELTIDGYSAPITAGNFIQNVEEGLYDGRPVNASYASVLVTGNPRLPKPPLPLEILPAGEFEPIYRLPLDIQGGELPVLPLSIPGAVAMAHIANTDNYVSGDEFFIGKFNQQQGVVPGTVAANEFVQPTTPGGTLVLAPEAGLAGLAFDEGTFAIFGYVTEGLDTVEALAPGDIIKKAVVVSGADKLVRPATAAPAVAAAPSS